MKNENQIISKALNEVFNKANEISIERKIINIDIPAIMVVILEDKSYSYIGNELKKYGLLDIDQVTKFFYKELNNLPTINKTDSEFEIFINEKNGILDASKNISEVLSNCHKKEELVQVSDVVKEIVLLKQYRSFFNNAGLNLENYKNSKIDSEEDIQDDDEVKNYLINYNNKIEKETQNGIQMPVIGRTDEIRSLINIISKKGKKNPILVGKAGVGKTAIIEGFVQRLLIGDVPNDLKDKIVYSLDLNALVSGAKFRGDVEERMKKILNFMRRNERAIMFIDEIHTMMTTGASDNGSSGGVGAILKTDLARGYFVCIGTTTFDEYRKFIESDKAIERRFMKINVNEATEAETITIIRGIKTAYEQYHGVEISNDAIYSAVELSSRYIKDKNLPDKAIDLIDVASAKLKVENDTMPENIDIIKRRIDQINIELKVMNSGDDDKFMTELNEEKNDLNKKLINLQEKLKSEKSLIEELKVLKQKFSQNESDIKTATLKGDLNLAAKLSYDDKIKLVTQINEIETKIKEGFELLKIKIDHEAIADAVSNLTGIPLKKLLQGEAEKLLNLEDGLLERVIGQQEAADTIADVIRISKTGIGEENRPVGSFLFLGPTGVGKTEITKALSEIMFGSEKSVIRFDMSEFSESHAVAKLIGAPPGYVGYESGGELTEAVKRKPYSIVLFDEIEKAHPKFTDILLQVLDDGRLTDGLGNTVDFSNTIIILTSNIGSDYILDATEKSVNEGKEIDKLKVKEVLMTRLKESFRPEFINRLNDIIIFNALKRENMNSIAKIQLNNLKKRVFKSRSVTIDWDDKALDAIADIGFDPKFGARPLKRAITDHIQKSLSKMMLSGEIKENDSILISYAEDSFVFKHI